MTTCQSAMRLAAVAACAALLTSCGAGTATPTAPTGTGPRSGIWQGTLADANGTTGTLRVTIEERQIDAARSLYSGTWTATYQDRSRDGAGSLTGTISGSTGTLLLAPTVTTTCSGTPLSPAAGTYVSSQLTISSVLIQGPYSQALCAGPLNGTLSLTKQ